jgi:hypothetical protein
LVLIKLAVAYLPFTSSGIMFLFILKISQASRF